ncbi:hypothetical protein D9M71_611020 [compost metagenome]
MKGKRKVKTLKWQNVERLMAEARSRLDRRSSHASRFLDVALSAGRELEPVGLLAGNAACCAQDGNSKGASCSPK